MRYGLRYLFLDCDLKRSMLVFRIANVFFIFSVVFFHPCVSGESNRVVVVYPKIRAPYNQIFISIVSGVKDSAHGEVLEYAMEKNESTSKFEKWINRRGIKKIIALGNRSIRAVYQLENRENFSIVLGAATISPGGTSDFFSLSLIPSPNKIFSKLQELAPNVKTIHVVYEMGKQEAFIEQSKNMAESLGFRLVSYGASDVISMAEKYRKILDSMNSKDEALWLAKSARSIEKAIMGKILKKAWEDKLVVFSSNLKDVKRGALFSLYPDNKKMGGRLNELLELAYNGSDLVPKVFFSEDLHSGINIRTATHLSIFLKEDEKRSYSFVYPSR